MDKVTENITFIVKNERIPVEKSKLIKKVDYFSALLSGNYEDSNKNEYKVPFDSWSPRCIKDLVGWVRTNKKNCYFNSCSAQYLGDTAYVEMQRMTELLEVAHYYVITSLLNEIRSNILTSRLNPQTGIYLWLFSKKYPLLKSLEDAAYALCLRQFEKLNRYDLLALNFNDFISIVANVNLKCSRRYLSFIMLIWYKQNCWEYNIDKEEYNRLTKALETGSRKVDMQQCLAANSVHGDVVLLTWDGTSISDRIIKLPCYYSVKLSLSVVGTRLLAQAQLTLYNTSIKADFDLFYIEEHLLKNGFQTFVWKYSLICKEWIFVTSLMSSIKYMNVILMRSRIYFIGSKKSFMYTASQVDHMKYYDLDTGEWSNSKNVSTYFNCYSIDYGKFDGRNHHKMTLIHHHDILTKEDFSALVSPFDFGIAGISATLCVKEQLLCAAFTSNNEQNLWNLNFKTEKDSISKLPYPLYGMTANNNKIIGFSYADRKITVSIGYLDSNNNYKIKYRVQKNIKRSIREHHYGEKPPPGCFNVINTSSLYNLIPEAIEIANIINELSTTSYNL